MEAYPISAASGTGTDELVQALFDRIRKIRAAQPEAEELVLRPKPVETFTVTKGKEAYLVTGARPAQVLQKLGMDTDEARIEVERRLRRMGVVKALERAGVKSGDRVSFGDVEVEWPL
jgi:GTP-binding protein